MLTKTPVLLITWSACICTALTAPAATPLTVIDFETTPQGTPSVDDTPLRTNNPYTLANGIQVLFGVDETGDGIVDDPAYFEQVGNNGDDGFSGSPDGNNDTAAPGFKDQLGDFFLRSPNNFSDVMPPLALRIDLKPPSNEKAISATGEIWDIDGDQHYERWTVAAFDAHNTVLDEVLSPLGIDPADPNSLNRKPWVFDLSNDKGIDHILMVFTGTKTSGVGFAFNNFTATAAPIPEPATAAIILAALPLSLIRDLRRRVSPIEDSPWRKLAPTSSPHHGRSSGGVRLRPRS